MNNFYIRCMLILFSCFFIYALFFIFNSYKSSNYNMSYDSKISMCMGCHDIPNYKSVFPQVYHVPLLHKQNYEYIKNVLYEYKNGQRRSDTMHAVASSLSDKDIDNVAKYYSK